MAEQSVSDRLMAAAKRALGNGTTIAKSDKQVESLTKLGVAAVGYNSSDEEIADWEKKYWESQDALVEQAAREWHLNLFYAAGHQFLTWQRSLGRYIERKTLPWRVRSMYNVIGKAANLRVSRLTENKPGITVQATTTDRSDVEKTEYKETLFWYLWDELGLHGKIVRARRWSTKCASGFLKGGWDPDAGVEQPATKMVARYEAVSAPVPGANGKPQLDFLGHPIMQTTQKYAGIEEVYVDPKGKELGPVYKNEQDPDTQEWKRVRLPVPDACDAYCEGQAYIDVRSPFNIRWDPYIDDIADSWIVQDADIRPVSKILALFPDAEKKIADATPANGGEKAIQWTGLRPQEVSDAAVRSHMSGRGGGGTTGADLQAVDVEYVVRETWIFPKNSVIKALWGRKGAKLVTVGGVLVSKERLPEWALKPKVCPFVQFIDTPEEGNHYGKSPLRDLIPLQDDINRSRSQKAEGIALRERLLLGAPQNHQMSLSVMGGLPASLLTYRSEQHKPTPIELGRGSSEVDQFMNSSLEAVADVGNMNDASTGKLPAAGVSGKVVYALQYADERSISEASNLQDEALARVARLLDAITRVEYKEPRKIRVVGEDRAYLVEHEITPEHLDIDVDYRFTPGSMLSRQKEAVKNELLTLMDKGLIEPWKVKKYMPTGVPDAFRGSNDLQEARARRLLNKILHGDPAPVAVQPWDNAEVHLSVVEEFLITHQAEQIKPDERALVEGWWQQLKAKQSAVAAGQPTQQTPMQEQSPAPAAPPAGPIGNESVQQIGAQPGQQQLEQAAQQVAPPPGFGGEPTDQAPQM